MLVIIRPNSKEEYEFSLDVILEQYRPGVKLTTANIFVVLFQPVTKLLISNFIGLSFVGYFDFALRIQQQIHSLAQKGLFPLYTYYCKVRETPKKKDFVTSNIEICILLISPLLLLIMINSKGLLSNIYSGDFISHVYMMMMYLVIVSFLWGTSVMPIYFNLMAKSKFKYIYIYHLIILVLNSISFFVLFMLEFDNNMIIILSYSISMFVGYFYIILTYGLISKVSMKLITLRFSIPIFIVVAYYNGSNYFLIVISFIMMIIGLFLYVKTFNECKNSTVKFDF